MRPFLIGALTFAAWGLLPAPELAMGAGGRMRAPAAITCDRNQLTSYSGRVSGYRPGTSRTWLQISTDEDTLEALNIEHAGQPDASARYLLRGEAFPAAGLSSIESRPGKLIVGMRAVAWVCLDGKTAPLIDWQPPQP